MDKSILLDYFNGRLDSAGEKIVRHWLTNNPDDPTLAEVLSDLYDHELADHSQDAILESTGKIAFNKISGKLGIRASKTRRTTKAKFKSIAIWTIRIAACLCIPLATFVIILMNSRTDLISAAQWKEIIVPYGDTTNLKLCDGTMLHLNSGTRITYPTAFPGKNRTVYIDGEVLAEVAHNPRKPFIINSGHVNVKVLGTKFNFKSYEGSSVAELFLINGSVRFDITSQKGNEHRLIKMTPGELLQYDKKSGDLEINRLDPDNYKTFTDGGAINFFNMKLEDIVDDLERHFGKKIVITDESISQKRYFALFNNSENLNEILSSLSAAQKFTISSRDGILYIAK